MDRRAVVWIVAASLSLTGPGARAQAPPATPADTLTLREALQFVLLQNPDRPRLHEQSHDADPAARLNAVRRLGLLGPRGRGEDHPAPVFDGGGAAAAPAATPVIPHSRPATKPAA